LESCDALAWTTGRLNVPAYRRRLARGSVYGNVGPYTAIVDHAASDHSLIRLRQLKMVPTLAKNPIPSAHGTGCGDNHTEYGPETPIFHTNPFRGKFA